jgi:dTDP-4-dehydrorhamnose 3,5-epimerase
MKFTETSLSGAFMIEPERRSDERGFFSRVFCRDEFAAHGLDYGAVQCNISFNPKKSTLRGMHYQVAPHQEVKLVRCTMGTIFDVIVDLRRESQSLGNWFGLELSAENRRMLYVPTGFAHGYLTLADDTEVFYQVSEYYSPESERGARWNDPAFGIKWPLQPELISDKDREHPTFSR